MDAKITLSFNKKIIEQAKKFADEQNISLSRLTEYIFFKITSKNYRSLEDMPVADWINQLAEGQAEYHTKPRTRKAMKQEYYKSRK